MDDFSMQDALTSGPITLAFDNFTSLTRTPWAGRAIFDDFKGHLAGVTQSRIGESWEFSCDPQFPSRLLDAPGTLSDLIRQHPTEILSPAYRATCNEPGCDILVKLINADIPLSLQVHPSDDDPHLAKDECGKPESWLVLAAEPGAGVYLGFRSAIEKADLRRRLEQGNDISALLQFVPARPGDYFEIAPGVCHAIGAGLVLLEPQRVVSGYAGKTYRMWDWGRTYDSAGQQVAVGGKRRQLHIDEALRIVDCQDQVGLDFVSTITHQPVSYTVSEGWTCQSYPKNDHYQVHRIVCERGAASRLEVLDGFAVLLNLGDPDLELIGSSQVKTSVRRGQSVLLPHGGNPYRIDVGGLSGCFVLVVPVTATLAWTAL